MPESLFTFVQNDEGDWVGLYGPNGGLLYEGHSISESELLRLVGIPHTRVEGVDLSELGRLPNYLSGLAGLGGTTREVKP